MKRARDPDRLREAIAARTLSHREVSVLAGCSYGTVGFILAGKPCNPTLARRLARVVRRPLDDVFVDVASSNEQTIDQQGAVA